MALQPLATRRPVSEYEFPGSVGRHIRVRSNMFDMKILSSTRIGMLEVFATKRSRDQM